MIARLLLELLLFVQEPAVAPALRQPRFAEDPSALPGVRTLCGGREKRYILEANGGGLVLAGFGRGGEGDLVVVDGSTLERVEKGEKGEPPRLYLNDGGGRFAQ